jgi:hypothetical protein
MCKELELPNKVYRNYISNMLEMMYTKGKLDIVREFNNARKDK